MVTHSSLLQTSRCAFDVLRRGVLLFAVVCLGYFPASTVAQPCPPGSLAVDSGTPRSTPCILDPESDWLSRTTASGVFYAHNFTHRNAAKTQTIASTSDMLQSVAQNNGGASNFAVWDTANKVSGGGALKFRMLGGPAGRGSSTVGIDFAGVGVRTGSAGFKSVVKHEFYLQFAYYADSVHRNFFYDVHQIWGGKIAIIEAADTSFDVGEVVIRRDARPGGFIHGYRLASTSEYFLNRYGSIGDWIQYNFYDAGAPTVTSVDSMQRRHGPNWNQRSESTPDADIVASNAPTLVENGWTVIQVYLRQPTSGGFGGTVKVWMAPYGAPPKLVFGAMNGRLPAVGAMDGSGNYPAQIYTGVQLSNYHNQDQQPPANWPATDTFVSYDEIIASDSPIPFPGGYPIPFPGTTTPPNYPASGSTEWF